MIHKYIKYFYPDIGSEDPIVSCIEQLLDFLSLKQLTLRNILFLNIFFKYDNEFDTKIKYIEKQLLKYNLDVPTAKIPQNPENFNYVFEVWFITGDFNTVNFGDNFKIILRNNLFILYASIFNCKLYDENYFNNTFQELQKILDKNRFPINSIFRQWAFIGNILELNDGIQNYQKYNNLRAELYSKTQWKKGYPCATAIGIKSDALNISIIAKRGHLNYDEYNLLNPLQIKPFKYNNKILISSNPNNKPPLFERGKIICTEDNISFYISGTSSIRGQTTIGNNDIILQTKITIENIKTLLNPFEIQKKIKPNYFEKIKKINLMKSFSYLRIYLQDLKNINLIKPFILEEFDSVPTIYLEADICRQDLSIEIEGAIFI